MKKYLILLYLCISILFNYTLYCQTDTSEIYLKNGTLLEFDSDTLIFYFNNGVVNKYTTNEINLIKFVSSTNVSDDELSDILNIYNYPNPFSKETTIAFKSKSDGFALLTIFDENGQKVRIINKFVNNSAIINITWDGKDENGKLCSSGSYFFTLEMGNTIKTGKLLLIL